VISAWHHAAGRSNFDSIEVRTIEVLSIFHDFDDCWARFVGGQGAALAYYMSLAEDRRAEPRGRLRSTLQTPVEALSG
jgi:hypothetical protein